MHALTATRLSFVALLLSLGCDSGDSTCASLRDEVERENCQFELVATLFEDGDPAWKQQLAAVPTAASRDLVRLRLAIIEPQQGPAICAEVETDAARERCKQVVGRPHLASPPRPPGGGTP